MTALASARTRSASFVYRHVVGFEDTNVVGNVYYVSHLSWQGRCRELFLREHVPEILEEMQRGLTLVTLRCSCDYLGEVHAFDEIAVHMELREIVANRMVLAFRYVVEGADRSTVVARGEQQLACMRRVGEQLSPEPWPKALLEELAPYRTG